MSKIVTTSVPSLYVILANNTQFYCYYQGQQHLLSKDISDWIEDDSLEKYIYDTIDYLDTERIVKTSSTRFFRRLPPIVVPLVDRFEDWFEPFSLFGQSVVRGKWRPLLDPAADNGVGLKRFENT